MSELPNSMKFKKAVSKVKALPASARIDLMVKAKLISPARAQRAKAKLERQ